MAIVAYPRACTCNHVDDTVIIKAADDSWAWSVRLEREGQAALERAFGEYRRAILAALDLLGDVRADKVVDLLPWDDASGGLREVWERVMSRMLLAAGEHEQRALRLPPDAFTVENPYAAKWMESNGSERITWVTNETRDAVRDIINRGLADRRTIRETAKDIKASGLIGLRPDQVAASDRYMAQLEDSGMSAGEIDNAVAKYNKELLRQRTMLISRTETANGLTEGRRQAWFVARDRGYLPTDARRRWNAGSEYDSRGRKRTCDFCLDFHRQTAPLDGEYVSRSKRYRSNGPTGDSHPACRCSENIITTT